MSNKASASKSDQKQFWQMAIETWQSSGLSIRRFCKQEGLSGPSFYSWRKKLASVKPPETKKEKTDSSDSFIQVSLPTDKQSGLELALSSGNTLRIQGGIDRQTLSDVVSVLQQAGLC